MEDKDYKLYVRVTPETYHKIKSWADRLGLTMSQLSNVCVQTGLQTLIRAIAPEEAFTPKQLADIIMAGKDQAGQMDFNQLFGKGGTDAAE